MSIILILQLIVIVSVFNILAFIIFINEQKAQEVFLFQAFGASRMMIQKIWFIILFFLWLLSCLFSFVLLWVYQQALTTWSLIDIPGEIYNINGLYLKIETHHYGIVFSMALLWLILISLFGLWRMKRKSLLGNLRKEFA